MNRERGAFVDLRRFWLQFLRVPERREEITLDHLIGEHDNLVLSSQSSSHLSFPVAASLRHTCWHHQQCLQEPKTREKWIKFASLTEIVLEGFIRAMCSQCGGGCCPDS